MVKLQLPVGIHAAETKSTTPRAWDRVCFVAADEARVLCPSQSTATEGATAIIAGHSLRDVCPILDAKYLHGDPALAENAIRKLEAAHEKKSTKLSTESTQLASIVSLAER